MPSPRHLSLLLLTATLALGACRQDDAGTGEDRSIADSIRDEVREELTTQNLQVGGGKADLPRAEISPQGEFFIGGKKQPLDASQQALLLRYRTQLATVADAGSEVGLQGAALAGSALKEAAKGALGGDTKEGEARIEAEAERVRASARRLCDLLPGLHASQEAAKAAIPAFAPYADMDESDITDCRADIDRR
ncbi:hypothetical protein [Arenimonas sp. MALMAid1274]|uniref:hypothetical protein n=1 Tax=Arenimonas sp. MALMAid1274 TaxID=3411630 RepID=UPI003BA262BA